MKKDWTVFTLKSAGPQSSYGDVDLTCELQLHVDY